MVEHAIPAAPADEPGKGWRPMSEYPTEAVSAAGDLWGPEVLVRVPAGPDYPKPTYHVAWLEADDWTVRDPGERGACGLLAGTPDAWRPIVGDGPCGDGAKPPTIAAPTTDDPAPFRPLVARQLGVALANHMHMLADLSRLHGQTIGWPSAPADQRDAAAVMYCGLALGGETGEVLDLLKKGVRAGHPLAAKLEDELKLEMFDVLYYWTRLLRHMDVPPEEVIAAGYAKLARPQAEAQAARPPA